MTQSPTQPPTQPPFQPPSQPPGTRGPQRFAAPEVEPERASWPRAIGAGLALLLLIVGVPALLIAFTGGPPIPDSIPTRDDLTQPLSIDALFAVLRAVVWLAWLQFTICTIVEIVSIARGGGLPRPVPFSGPSQALARALVGAVLVGATVLGSTAGANAAPSTPPTPAGPDWHDVVGVRDPGPAPTASAPHRAVADAVAQGIDAGSAMTADAPDGRVPGDSSGRSHGPGSFSDDGAGSRSDSRDLSARSTDLTGSSLTPNQEGFDVRQDAAGQQDGPGGQMDSSPISSVPGVPASMTDVVGHRVVIVQPPDGHYHDNLWDIAERHLDDGRRWKEIYELNKGRLQPDGQELVIGRLIQPGWVLIMPDDAQDAPRVTGTPGHGRQGPHGHGGHQGPGATADGTVGPGVAHGAGAVGGALGDGPGSLDDGRASGRSDVAREQSGDSGSGVGDVVTGILAGTGGGGLVAGILALAIAGARRRRPGSGPTGTDPEVEVALRVAADEERTLWIDRALRSLSAICRAERIALPQVYAATVSDDAIRLRVAPPVLDAPAPWTVHDGGSTWQLDRTAVLPEGSGHAPYPGLVCLGRDDDGADLLVDLEAVGGVFAIDGAHHAAREVVSAIAVQLALAPWADAQAVHGYDLSEHLAVLSGTRFRHVAHLGALLDQWRDTSPGRPAREVLGGRIGRRPGVEPQYLLLGTVPPDLDTHDAGGVLARLGAAGTRGVGIVSAVPVPGSRWRVHVDDSGRLTIPLLDVDVHAVRLTDATAGSLHALLAQVHDDGDTAITPVMLDRPAVGEPVRPGADSELAMAPVTVSVLGSPLVRGAGDLDPVRLELATELVVFLALASGPVHPSVVAASLWPRGVTADVRDATIDRAREWLGADAEGNHRLGETTEGRLFLSDDVLVDWDAVRTLLLRSRDAVPADERDLLRRALRLVRGPAIAERPARRYTWLPRVGLEEESVSLIVDAAHRLAVLSFDDDPAGAAAACRAGLRLAPASQVLWRDLLTAEARNPEGPGAAIAAREMMDELASVGAPLDAETDALVIELVPNTLPDGIRKAPPSAPEDAESALPLNRNADSA
ncbi:LysM peptidoglycan-binding domain-containing protein [Nocardioides sp. GXZ039]|uniref:LysM peptidoglycan-binding domain-containing protein n=1 Tax=Nocardioides sp. GXZ039 TaxID=3136018 RepID=UPI0030F48B1F